MKTEYYAEGSIYELRDGEHLKKDSFKMFSPDGKKININIDLNGDKMFLRNANIENIMPMNKKHIKTVMPIRSFKPKLLEELKKMETKTQEKNDKPKKTIKTIKTKTVKIKKVPKISPKRKQLLRKKIKKTSQIKKSKQQSAKNKKKSNKTVKSKQKNEKIKPKPITAQSPPDNQQERASYLSNTFL